MVAQQATKTPYKRSQGEGANPVKNPLSVHKGDCESNRANGAGYLMTPYKGFLSLKALARPPRDAAAGFTL